MSDFILPLELETWFVNVFAGSIDIFTAVVLLVIMGLAGYFRMSGVALIFMIGLFFAMFQGYINQEIYFILLAIGGLLIGFVISNIVKR